MFKAHRTFKLDDFGWADCSITFQAVSWKEMRDLETARHSWQNQTDEKEIEKAANQIVDIMKTKFVSGQAIDEKDQKVDITLENFEELPFDIFLKLTGWITSGEVDESFLDSSTKPSTTLPH